MVGYFEGLVLPEPGFFLPLVEFEVLVGLVFLGDRRGVGYGGGVEEAVVDVGGVVGGLVGGDVACWLLGRGGGFLGVVGGVGLGDFEGHGERNKNY